MKTAGGAKPLHQQLSEHDRRNLDLARQVLADAGNPAVAHLVDWAKRVVERLEK